MPLIRGNTLLALGFVASAGVLAAPAAEGAVKGGGVVIAGNTADASTQMDLARRAGVRWVYFLDDWSDLEPTPGGHLATEGSGRERWDALGVRLAQARARGLRVMLTFKRAPSWARVGDDERAGPSREHYGSYASFIGDISRVYGGMIDAYGTWNEPNIPLFWNSPTAAGYAQLHRATAAQIRANDPTARIVLGPFAGGARNSYTFLKSVYRRGVRGSADRVGWNVFPARAPQASGVRGSELGGLFRLAAILRKVDSGRKIWINEIGWSTCRCGEQTVNVVSDRTQADYSLGAISYIRRYLRGGVDRFFIYNMRDGEDPRRWSSNQGLLDVELKPKPAYHVVRASTRLLKRPSASWRRNAVRGRTSINNLRMFSRKGVIFVGAQVGVPRAGRVQVLGFWRGRWRTVQAIPVPGAGEVRFDVSDQGFSAIRLRAKVSGSSRWTTAQMPVPPGPILRT